MRINAGHILAGTVAFLAITGVGASVFYFLREPTNPQFLDFPTITLLHVVPGGLYLALAPFQFIRGIRTRSIAYHRFAGRLLVITGLVLGAAAMFLAIVIPFSGTPERIINGFFGLFFLFALTRAFRCIREGQVERHRAWMIRAFAIGLSIATMRLIFVPALIVIGNPNQEQIELLSIVSFTVAFCLHAAFAEYWIRRDQRMVEQPV